MYYSYVEIEYVATSFSPARTDLAVKLLNPLFAGLLPLRGDMMFGAPFLSWQDASSLTSPTLDAAAPKVNVPPFALSGASPSLHA
jgi:hypothetical protein